MFEVKPYAPLNFKGTPSLRSSSPLPELRRTSSGMTKSPMRNQLLAVGSPYQKTVTQQYSPRRDFIKSQSNERTWHAFRTQTSAKHKQVRLHHKPKHNNNPSGYTKQQSFKPTTITDSQPARRFHEAVSKSFKEYFVFQRHSTLPSLQQYQSILVSYPELKGMMAQHPQFRIYFTPLFLKLFLKHNQRKLAENKYSRLFCLHTFRCLCSYACKHPIDNNSSQFAQLPLDQMARKIDLADFKPSQTQEVSKTSKLKFYESVYKRYNEVIELQEKKALEGQEGDNNDSSREPSRFVNKSKIPRVQTGKPKTILEQLRSQQLYSEKWQQLVHRSQKPRDQAMTKESERRSSKVKESDAILGSIYVLKKQTQNMIKFLEDRINLS